MRNPRPLNMKTFEVTYHWAFDVGWFTLNEDFTIKVSSRIDLLPRDQGKIGSYDILREFTKAPMKVNLPVNESIFPHKNSIMWHRAHVFAE